MSPELTESNATLRPTMDEKAGLWHPARISDRKLLELHDQLERIRQLGDAFAEVNLAPEARQRAHNLAKPFEST